MQKQLCISGPSLPDSTGEVVGLEDGVLRVRCERRIPDTTATTIAFDHIRLSGTVLGSEPMGSEWGISIALNFSRRREARLPVSGKVTVGVVSGRGTKLYDASMIDVSPSGFSLQVPLSVPLGARIYIETTTEIILGEVRHRRRSRRRSVRHRRDGDPDRERFPHAGPVRRILGQCSPPDGLRWHWRGGTHWPAWPMREED